MITKKRASGRAVLKSHEVKPYDQRTEGPTLYILELTESFHGDIEGENQGRSLRAVNSDGSGSYVGFGRVIGKVGSKSGSFLLQVHGTFTSKRALGDWFVVPGSGTGDLGSLRGEGGFTTNLGQPAEIWLDYWFE
jgi:hypothetical protein